jgi:hypothetical protein
MHAWLYHNARASISSLNTPQPRIAPPHQKITTTRPSNPTHCNNPATPTNQNITTFYGVTASPDWLIVTELLQGSLYRLLHSQSATLPVRLQMRIAKVTNMVM